MKAFFFILNLIIKTNFTPWLPGEFISGPQAVWLTWAGVLLGSWPWPWLLCLCFRGSDPSDMNKYTNFQRFDVKFDPSYCKHFRLCQHLTKPQPFCHVRWVSVILSRNCIAHLSVNATSSGMTSWLTTSKFSMMTVLPNNKKTALRSSYKSGVSLLCCSGFTSHLFLSR